MISKKVPLFPMPTVSETATFVPGTYLLLPNEVLMLTFELTRNTINLESAVFSWAMNLSAFMIGLVIYFRNVGFQVYFNHEFFKHKRMYFILLPSLFLAFDMSNNI